MARFTAEVAAARVPVACKSLDIPSRRLSLPIRVPELRLRDVQCMVVFTNKSFVYTNERDKIKYMNMLEFQYCHFSIKNQIKLSLQKMNSAVLAFRRITLSRRRGKECSQILLFPFPFWFLFFLRQGLTMQLSLVVPELCRPGVVLNLPVVCRQPSYRFVCPEKTETHNLACLWLPPKRHLSTCC